MNEQTNKPMTGKDLILYILENNLENAPVFDNGRFLMFSTIYETAARFGTGPVTVQIWVEKGYLPYVKIGSEIYIPYDAKLDYRGTKHV